MPATIRGSLKPAVHREVKPATIRGSEVKPAFLGLLKSAAVRREVKPAAVRVSLKTAVRRKFVPLVILVVYDGMSWSPEYSPELAPVSAPAPELAPVSLQPQSSLQDALPCLCWSRPALHRLQGLPRLYLLLKFQVLVRSTLCLVVLFIF